MGAPGAHGLRPHPTPPQIDKPEGDPVFVTHVPLTYPSCDPLAWMATVSGSFGLRKLSQGVSFSFSFLVVGPGPSSRQTPKL